jgi:hypothetical protein
MITSLDTDFLPPKAWFTLKEACDLKGLNYRTALNKKELQPPNDNHIGGRKMYRRSTILQWILLTDEDIKAGKTIKTHRDPIDVHQTIDLNWPLSLLRPRAAVGC